MPSLQDALLQSKLATPEQLERAEVQKKKERDEEYGRKLMEKVIADCPPQLIPSIRKGIKEHPGLFTYDNVHLLGAVHQRCKFMASLAGGKDGEVLSRAAFAQELLNCPALLPMMGHLTLHSIQIDLQREIADAGGKEAFDKKMAAEVNRLWDEKEKEKVGDGFE